MNQHIAPFESVLTCIDYWKVYGEPRNVRFPNNTPSEVQYEHARMLYPTDKAFDAAVTARKGYDPYDAEWSKNTPRNQRMHDLMLYEPEWRVRGEVLEDLNAALKRGGIEFDESSWNTLLGETLLWPSTQRQIVCFAVTGGNEGHYGHLDVLTGGYEMDDRRSPNRDGKSLVGWVIHIAGFKTFQGMAFAQRVCNATSLILGA